MTEYGCSATRRSTDAAPPAAPPPAPECASAAAPCAKVVVPTGRDDPLDLLDKTGDALRLSDERLITRWSHAQYAALIDPAKPRATLYTAGIHGTNQPGLVPGRPSHGCIRGA